MGADGGNGNGHHDDRHGDAHGDAHRDRHDAEHPPVRHAEATRDDPSCAGHGPLKPRRVIREVEANTLMFSDDGLVPNNPSLPLVVYRGAIDLNGIPDPAMLIDMIFAAHDWSDSWQGTIFTFPHYHAHVHEALGVARGSTRVRFGGAKGPDIEVEAGDVCVLPAGTCHQRMWASRDLVVVGAYPRPGLYDMRRATRAQRVDAVAAIAKVPLPETDPVYGPAGPLRQLWKM